MGRVRCPRRGSMWMLQVHSDAPCYCVAESARRPWFGCCVLRLCQRPAMCNRRRTRAQKQKSSKNKERDGRQINLHSNATHESALQSAFWVLPSLAAMANAVRVHSIARRVSLCRLCFLLAIAASARVCLFAFCYSACDPGVLVLDLILPVASVGMGRRVVSVCWSYLLSLNAESYASSTSIGKQSRDVELEMEREKSERSGLGWRFAKEWIW